jgi:hypothetical protein
VTATEFFLTFPNIDALLTKRAKLVRRISSLPQGRELGPSAGLEARKRANRRRNRWLAWANKCSLQKPIGVAYAKIRALREERACRRKFVDELVELRKKALRRAKIIQREKDAQVVFARMRKTSTDDLLKFAYKDEILAEILRRREIAKDRKAARVFEAPRFIEWSPGEKSAAFLRLAKMMPGFKVKEWNRYMSPQRYQLPSICVKRVEAALALSQEKRDKANAKRVAKRHKEAFYAVLGVIREYPGVRFRDAVNEFKRKRDNRIGAGSAYRRGEVDLNDLARMVVGAMWRHECTAYDTLLLRMNREDARGEIYR